MTDRPRFFSRTGPRRAGFSLIEILVMMAIIAIFMGITLVAFPRRQSRDATVRAAAEELVGVLRATRSRAMERRATYTVTFNIQNTPGTSGAQLMNGTGGHWYRVVGPLTTAATFNLPPVFDPNYCLRDMSTTNVWTANTQNGKPVMRHWEGVMERAWVDPMHVLPPGDVRFVALTDEDNGSFLPPMPPAAAGAYPATYPRPWFGSYDAVAKKLYAWGGYDSTIAGSGFYYQGADGALTGSVNTVDRLVSDDTNDDSWWCAPGTTNPQWPYNAVGDNDAVKYTIGKANAPRPLINAVWQDFSLMFRPDGTVSADWMRLRHAYNDVDTSAGMGGHVLKDFGPCDRTNGARFYTTATQSLANGTGTPEASDFSQRSGFYFITLGPDLASDSSSYPTAQAALSALMPLFRVGVSQYGEVRLFQVTNSKRNAYNLDSTVIDNGWNTAATTNTYYNGQVLTRTDLPLNNIDHFPLPVIDMVNTDMLTHRIMWYDP